jgi:hypothetical protein
MGYPKTHQLANSWLSKAERSLGTPLAAHPNDSSSSWVSVGAFEDEHERECWKLSSRIWLCKSLYVFLVRSSTLNTPPGCQEQPLQWFFQGHTGTRNRFLQPLLLDSTSMGSRPETRRVLTCDSLWQLTHPREPSKAPGFSWRIARFFLQLIQSTGQKHC